MIKKALPYALQLLEQHNLRVTFIDVGSRNGVLELADLAHFVEAYGFEPNPEEYHKLVSEETDLFQGQGVSSPAYRNLTYFPYALGDACERRDFYVTPGAGACGLLEPNLERLEEIVWKGRSYQQNFSNDIFADFRIIDVDMRTLDEVASEHSITHIDYLKIDVEGSEYEVLLGASTLLPTTGVIKVETCFIPFRKGQKLFSHVDLLLRDFGFDLLRYEIHPAQIGYKQRQTPICYLPKHAPGRFADPFGQPLSCDAVYVNRSMSDPDLALTQALVLMEKNYFDEALHVLRTKTTVTDAALFDFLLTYNGGLGWQHWREIGYQLVDKVLEIARHPMGFIVR